MTVRIITDSTSDIQEKDAKQLGITIVPLKVIFGDTEYQEGIEITMDEFYNKLVSSEKLPTTSQPSPDSFLKYYMEAKEAGDSVVAILISSKLSGTYQSAMIAKDMAEYDDIHVVDSENATTGMRLLVEKAVDLRKEGKKASEIAEEIEILKEKVVLLALVDTLDNLYKGGRLSKTSAILGSLLKFKPILRLDEGVIGLLDKERGLNKGIARMITCVDEIGHMNSEYPVYIGYTAEDSKGKMLKDKLKEVYSKTDSNIILHPVGCVVGTHVGPGACVLTYIKK